MPTFSIRWVALFPLFFSSVMRFNALKFQEWFPNFEADPRPSWTTGSCQGPYRDYRDNRTSGREHLRRPLRTRPRTHRREAQNHHSRRIGRAGPRAPSPGRPGSEHPGTVAAVVAASRTVVLSSCGGAPAVYNTRPVCMSTAHRLRRWLPSQPVALPWSR